MDIILPKLYVKQSGALYGLGAAGDALQPGEALTGQALADFRRTVAKLNVAVGSTIADVDAKRSWAITATQEQFLAVMEDTKGTLRSWYAVGAEISGKGTIEGQPITKKQAALYLELGGRLVTTYAQAAQAITDYAPTAMLKNAIFAVVSDLFELANELFTAAKKVVSGAAKTAGLLEYLPWIVVGGLFAFYVLPSILRYRREGEAGLEADLRAGRSRVESGVCSAATRSVSGLSRRRRTRRMR